MLNPVALLIASAVCFVRSIGDAINISGLILAISRPTFSACVNPISFNEGLVPFAPENARLLVSTVSPWRTK